MAILRNAVSVALMVLLFPPAQFIIQKLSRSVLLPFCLGLVFVPALKKAVGLISKWRGSNHDDTTSSSVYGLDHAILNLELPPRSMWMNMGYWEDSTTDMPTACSALLEQVLKHAGLLIAHAGATLEEEKEKVENDADGNDEEEREDSEDDASSSSSSPQRHHRRPRPVHIIDIGIGCGDQTVHLLELSRNSSSSSQQQQQQQQSGYSFPQIGAYVGITKDGAQFRYARGQIASRVGGTTASGGPVEVFCGDAGDVRTWSAECVRATKAHLAEGADGPDVWLLGLDCLYHLDPDRLPLFVYARGIGAGVMAFDLLLPDETQQTLSLPQKAALWLVCRLTDAPWENFMTPAQYRRQLVEAGYDADKVEIVDISDKVFGGLAAFLERRDRELRMIGRGIGPFHVAKWIFGWWARSGVVRGCIVVARR